MGDRKVLAKRIGCISLALLLVGCAIILWLGVALHLDAERDRTRFEERRLVVSRMLSEHKEFANVEIRQLWAGMVGLHGYVRSDAAKAKLCDELERIYGTDDPYIYIVETVAVRDPPSKTKLSDAPATDPRTRLEGRPSDEQRN